MLGFRFIKFDPSTFIQLYQNGKVKKKGSGLSFFFYAPTSSIVAVPIGNTDSPFIFEEVTADYQTVTIQGQISFRIADPETICKTLNFTLDRYCRQYITNDYANLPQRIMNAIQILTKRELQKLNLREALKKSDSIVEIITKEICSDSKLLALGIEITGFSILAIKPNQETARALEAEAREQLLKEADDAIYTRRNASVEQERTIKENELNTEIAVENKQRQIKEAQMEAVKSIQEKKQLLAKSELTFQISQESEKAKLVDLSSANEKKEADVRAYAIATSMKSFQGVDAAVLQALASTGMKPDQLIAQAFQGLATNANKIGQLNITPELLSDLINNKTVQ